MLRTIAGAVAPALLLMVALLDWSLISLLFLIAFLIMQYGNAQRGVNSQSGNMIWLIVIILSVVGIIAEIGFYVVWSVRTEEWKVAKLLWAKLFGLYRLNPWEGGYFIYILITLQVLLILVASVALYAHGTQPSSEVSSVRGSIYQLKNYCGLLLPLVQLVVGVSYPCWIALPFFLGCCCELLKWCFTSSIFDLPWCKRTLQSYAALNILLLYVYQLPVDVSLKLSFVADYVGLFKVTRGIGWSEAIFGGSVILFFIMLCSEKENMSKTAYSRVESHSSFASNGLTEELLPSHSSLSCSMYIPLLNAPPVREISFQRIVINFFVFGIPVSVLFLSIWSFTFPSLCAFILIIYCEYVISSSLSLRMFNRLNVLLLSFILVWSLCKYIFYSTTKVSGDVIKKDLNIWYMIGLYDHSIPGLLLFIQYCLAVLFTFSIISCKYITGYLNTAKKDEFKDESDIEEGQRKIALAIALIAWCLRKISRPVAVVLVFTLGLKPGVLHAVYMTFFLVYLLKSTVGKRVRQSLVLISALHFALLYLLRLSLITDVLGHKGEKVKGILLQLGLSEDTSLWEFLGIALLLCFSSIQDHGTGLLFSLNKILQRFPQSPFNFVFMRADFWQMVLLTIYSSDDFVDTYPTIMLEGNLIAKYLSSIGQKCQKAYRCCGAYIVFLTILFTVYMVDPNYLSFGYLFFLLLWIIGRQLVERTRRRLWMPLMIYSILSFIVIYMTSSFPFFWSWIPMKEIIFSYMGFDPQASTFKNLWDAAAVLAVMQLYRYEREQVFIDPSHNESYDNDKVHNKILGFLKRFIIWHSGKMLTVSIFYASITPVSVSGFVYLISMIVLSNFPKATPLPAKIYATYTGMLIASDYLFQILGGQLQMFPGQKYADISGWLGFQIFEKGFWGIESGLRSKILVIIACAVQYNVFRWLELMPASLVTRERWAEPCRLFVCHENNAEKSSQEEAPLLKTEIQAKTILQHQAVVDTNHETASMDGTPRGSLFYSFWGSTKESQRWNRKVLLCLKKERYEAQLRSLKLYAKFWTENLFNLFGLEINMLTLLLASFTVLNSVSLLYVSILCLCILLNRRKLHCMWPFYVVLFACILTFEYIALANAFAPWSHKGNRKMRCHDCWNSSVALYSYCTRCWFGVVVDDRQMLVTYFLVFFVATFKLRGNLSGGYTDSDSYHRLYSEKSDRLVWKEISFETKGQWTWLDHFRLFFYRHLLDVVLMLVLITGTLEYDILHLGYLAFAMVAFRARDGILKRKNRIFKYLRIYNFVLIVLSLAFQAPFFGDVENRKCSMPDSLYGAIGFYKYDYGFRITSRSALIDIIIFCLVGLQSYIFRSRAFGQVIKYLEAEQIDAILNAQEKRAAWKTKQLQHIREIEDRKKKRRMQVEKMKTEMNNIQGLTMRSPSNPSNEDYSLHDLDRSRKNANSNPLGYDNSNNQFRQRPLRIHEAPPDTFALSETVGNEGIKKKCDAFPNEISEFKESSNRKNITAETTSYQTEEKAQEAREKRFATAVQLIGNGVAQVHSLGNQAMANLVNFFNIEKSEFDDNELSPNQGDVIADQSIEEKGDILQHPEEISSASQATEHVTVIGKWQWFYKLFGYCWSRVRNNIDSICYCCFVLVFLWNFSLLAMVYLVALFLYALLVNPGPGSLFWITMLIYTELIILFQYLYQISANHCGPQLDSEFQRKIGFSATSENSSFVVSVLPLFTVYLFTLVQCSVKIKDSEWMSVSEYGFLHRRPFQQNGNEKVHWKENIWSLLQSIVSGFRMIGRLLKRYWQSLTYGSESPPHFVQVSMHITVWPEDGIQPERIESSINRVLDTYHRRHCNQTISATHSVSRVRVESIERSPDDSNVALAVFEVIYASSLTACPAHAHYAALKPAADVASEILSAKESGIFDEICFPYPVVSVIAGGKREIDLYAFIFCADLVAFFLVGIFYQSMIKHNNEFLDVYQLEDQFPKEFVFVLMILFFLIVVDRIIYLWSFGWGKVIYYFFSLVLFTYSVTLYAWNMEAKGQFKGELALRAFYLTKAISLTLEALQIKFGLPHKSALYGQFLTRRITNANFLGFRIYRALPFLYELRCVLDWSCTATALTMYDWLKLEDIYASLYLVKCDVTLSRAKHQLGEKQSKTTKFWSGICLFLILICVIWTPMLMYSSGNPTNIANPVTAVMTQIDVNTQGGRLTLYQNSMCHCFPWDELLANGYNLDPQGYLKTYDSKDLQLICCEADANSYWMVPSSALKRFMISVNKDTSIIFSWEFTRGRPKGKEVAKYNPIDPVFPYGLQEVLNRTSNVVQLSSIYPRYLRLTGSGEVHRLEQTDDVYGINGSLFLNRSPQPWWSFHEENSPEGCRELRGPSSIVFSEETPQGFIGETLSKFSIWSLYITFVLAVGRFIRLQCSDLRMRIPYENFPSCDRLIAICEDIYAARAAGELVLEELLFITLVDIYRSPHVLIEYTKED